MFAVIGFYAIAGMAPGLRFLAAINFAGGLVAPFAFVMGFAIIVLVGNVTAGLAYLVVLLRRGRNRARIVVSLLLGLVLAATAWAFAANLLTPAEAAREILLPRPLGLGLIIGIAIPGAKLLSLALLWIPAQSRDYFRSRA